MTVQLNHRELSQDINDILCHEMMLIVLKTPESNTNIALVVLCGDSADSLFPDNTCMYTPMISQKTVRVITQQKLAIKKSLSGCSLSLTLSCYIALASVRPWLLCEVPQHNPVLPVHLP